MEQIEACIAEIKSWMGSNFLKLNDEKTEFILFGSEHDLKALPELTISIGYEEVKPSRTVRNINWCHAGWSMVVLPNLLNAISGPLRQGRRGLKMAGWCCQEGD